MKKTLIIGIVLILILVLAGCEQFFTTNVFGAFEDKSPPSTKELSESFSGDNDLEAVTALKERLSPSVVEDMTEEEIQDIITVLEDETGINEAYDAGDSDDPEAVETYQIASITAANLTLSTGGDEIVDNVAPALMDTMDSMGSEDFSAESSFEDIMDSLSGGEQVDPNTVESLVSAGAYYNNYAATLDPDGDGVYSTSDEVNSGEVFQDSIVPLTVNMLFTNMDGDDEDKYAAIADVMDGDIPITETNPDTGETQISAEFTALFPQDSTVEEQLDITQMESFTTLAGAAGLALPESDTTN
ncbi:MAG: hypothetical protein ACLFR1_12730 [Spirochaetia bacterium]